MSVTWRHEGAGGPEEDLAAETLACVERTPVRVTMEWRREVVAPRFRPDGWLAGAWRGPPGGEDTPLRCSISTRRGARRSGARRPAAGGEEHDPARGRGDARGPVLMHVAPCGVVVPLPLGAGAFSRMPRCPSTPSCAWSGAGRGWTTCRRWWRWATTAPPRRSSSQSSGRRNGPVQIPLSWCARTPGRRSA